MREGARRFAAALSCAKEKHPEVVSDFRQRGYLMYLEMKNEDLGFGLCHEPFANGLAAEQLANGPKNIRIMVSLTAPLQEIDQIAGIFARSLEAVASQHRREPPIESKVSRLIQKVS